MLSLYSKGLHLPILMVIDGGEGAEPSALKIALIIDMASEVIEDPLDRTRVREEREAVLERQSVS